MKLANFKIKNILVSGEVKILKTGHCSECGGLIKEGNCLDCDRDPNREVRCNICRRIIPRDIYFINPNSQSFLGSSICVNCASKVVESAKAELSRLEEALKEYKQTNEYRRKIFIHVMTEKVI